MGVGVSVFVGVDVGVRVGVSVFVAVAVAVAVLVGVRVDVGDAVRVAVAEKLGVAVGVDVACTVTVADGVFFLAFRVTLTESEWLELAAASVAVTVNVILLPSATSSPIATVNVRLAVSSVGEIVSSCAQITASSQTRRMLATPTSSLAATTTPSMVPPVAVSELVGETMLTEGGVESAPGVGLPEPPPGFATAEQGHPRSAIPRAAAAAAGARVFG